MQAKDTKEKGGGARSRKKHPSGDSTATAASSVKKEEIDDDDLPLMERVLKNSPHLKVLQPLFYVFISLCIIHNV